MHNFILYQLPADRGFRSSIGSGLGIICPVFLETLTFVPSSKYLRATFVGSLKIIILVTYNSISYLKVNHYIFVHSI